MKELFRDFLAESVEQLEALKAQWTEEHLTDREACRNVCCPAQLLHRSGRPSIRA